MSKASPVHKNKPLKGAKPLLKVPAAPPPAPLRERSLGYPGWRVVFACFMVATFSWGLGFYGHGIYLAELQRAKGWPTSLMSTATTLYYLSGSLLVIYVSDFLQRLGPRLMLLTGSGLFALAVAGIGYVSEPWQLFAAYFVMAIGWMLASVGALTNVAGLWFFEKRGLAISLALTGASFGGIVLTPLMVAAVSRLGFHDAMLATAAATFVVLVATILLCVGKPPEALAPAAGTRAAQSGGEVWTRPRALRSLQFWTMTLAVRARDRRAGRLPRPSARFSCSRRSACRRRATWSR